MDYITDWPFVSWSGYSCLTRILLSARIPGYIFQAIMCFQDILVWRLPICIQILDVSWKCEFLVIALLRHSSSIGSFARIDLFLPG